MKKNLPVIVLKGIVLLPNNDIRLEFDNDFSRNVIDVSEMFHDKKLLLVTDEDPLEEVTKINELPRYGVIAKISHKIELPNNKVRVILTGLNRANVIEYLNINNKEEVLESIIENDNITILEGKDEEKLVKKLYKEIEEYIKELPYVTNELLSLINNLKSLEKITDIVVPYLQISNDRVIEYLKNSDSKIRFHMILEDIYNEKDMFQMEREIDDKVKKVLDDSQRDFILREKIKVIKDELKDYSIKETDLDVLRNRLISLKAPKKIITKIDLEIRRYESLPSSSPELSISRNYIEWLLDLPWNKCTSDNDDLIDVREILDASHNGLEKVKTRIIEYLAVKQLTNCIRGPIICLVGPPGVGKTSLAFSIANAMHRNFVKISLGGVNDESEIIGHRKTYIGANPGRIISSLKKAKSSNPVFLIDEIDKMTKNFKGDPASVLLEILDPEQNKYFSDNYIEEEYDLSKVMFIATANYIDDIPEALRDRLEIVKLSGYTEYEKLDIARKYLLPKICKEHGINGNSINIKNETIFKIIQNYTKEAGVRELDRILSAIIRKIVTELATKRITMNKFYIDNKKLLEYIGKEKYSFNNTNKKPMIGVVNGLAYTPFGGDILPIEVNYFKGKGELILTGSLGDVMKESALVAVNYIKSNSKLFKIDYEKLVNNDIHIHVPEGAVSKDGPSAGIALTTALISLFTNNKIDSYLAMTGEITLRGHILPIGGLKEKSIGAYRNGIKKIIMPFENIKDLDEIPIEIKENIEFITVKNYGEVYKLLKESKCENEGKKMDKTRS